MPPDISGSVIKQGLIWLFGPGFLLLCALSTALTQKYIPKEKKKTRLWFVFLAAGLLANCLVLSLMQFGFFKQFALP